MCPTVCYPSGDVATHGTTALCSLIYTLRQQLQLGEERLKASESDLLGGLPAADERIRKASASTKESLKQQSAQKQELKPLQAQLSAHISTFTVDIESDLASVCKELAVANNTIGRLRSNMINGHDHMA